MSREKKVKKKTHEHVVFWNMFVSLKPGGVTPTHNKTRTTGEKVYPTRASCCLVRPPLRMSSTKLPTSGQFAGPGIASRLCALEAAWAHGAASTASFSPSTHTEDVGLKCCNPTGFFFSSSTIWGTFLICALILKFVAFFLKMRKCLMFSSALVAKLFFVILGCFSFLELSKLTAIYIPWECLFLTCTEPIRGLSCIVWPTSPPFIYGSTFGGSYDPR